MASNAGPEGRLTLEEYQRRAIESNQFRGKDTAMDQLRFGLFGEIGTVLALVKKSHRDLQSADLDGIAEELGDALWYLTTAAVECNSSLDNIGRGALVNLQNHFVISCEEHDGLTGFQEFDGLIDFSRAKLKDDEKLMRLRQLGADCGRLLMENVGQDLAAVTIVPMLSNILADMVLVGALFGHTFLRIAQENLKKIEARWPPSGTKHTPLFDEAFSTLERFPRNFTMQFVQIPSPVGRPYVIQQLRGVNIGDRLTDNRTEADGYRFHDVFHLAYLVHLGWSPVMRALLKLKRKSDPAVDENQDGARAIIIEEGIATWIFNHAHRRDDFREVDVGRLDYNMLKQVLSMVEGYEVDACPMWQWERAILDGFKVFRQLKTAGQGGVHVDLDRREISFVAKGDSSNSEVLL